jgi:hypothetical protein
LIQSQNLDLEKPFSDFENTYSFQSLRKSIILKEDIWLQSLNPRDEDFPHNHPVQSHAERSLWNEKGEIMVAGKIYKYTDENYIKIEDGDFNKLAQINNGDTSVYNSPAVSVESNSSPNNPPTSGTTCERNSSQNRRHIYNDFKVEYANAMKSKKWEYGKHHMYGSTYLYKRNGNSSTYYRYTGNLTTIATGNLFFNCNNQTSITTGGSIRAQSALIDWKRKDAFGVRYQLLLLFGVQKLHNIKLP